MQKSIHSIFTFAAAGLLALACSSCSPAAKKARTLADANRYFDSGQYEKAEIEYLNVLQIERLNPQAIGRLGIIYFDQGRLGRVMPLLLKGRELQPDNLEIRLKLGLVYLSSGKLKEARDEANFILDHRPQDADAPLLLVEASVKPEEIAATQQRLAKLPPPAAEGAPVLVARGTLEFRQRHIKEATAAFQRALTLDPKSSAVQAAIGTLYLTQNDLPHAEQAFKLAAELAPARSPRRLLYARFKMQKGEGEPARKALEEITRKTPDYLPAWMLLANLAVADKKYAESAAFVAKVLALDPYHFDASFLSGRLKLAQGEKGKAVVEMERLVRIYPQAPQAHYQLGMAYYASGDSGKAAGSLNQAVTLAPGFADAVVLLAEINVQRGDYRLALGALKPLVQQHPEIAQAWLLLANAYRGQGDLNEALAVYRQMEKLFPRNPQPPLLAGTVLLQQNKLAEARQAFNKALELGPDFMPVVEQLINLDLVDKNYPAALQRVEVQRAKNPKLPGLYLLQAKIFLVQPDTKQAETSLLKEIELQPDAPTAYFLLAQLYMSTNQKEKALANLREVSAKNPKDTGALMLIGTLNEQQKDYTAAREAYEKLLAVNPKFSVALNNLACLYSEHFNLLDKAQDLAQKARNLLPQEPHAADTLGWILYKQRQYPRALSLLQESAGKLPDAADVQFHLGMTHYMLGEEEPARNALQLALQLDKNFPGNDEAQKRLAILAIEAGTGVREALEKTVAEQPDDPVALIRLAAVYERAGAADKAINAYQKALQANPKSVKATLGLVQLYLAQKDTPKALEMAKTARKLAPDDPDVAQTLGRLAYQTGDFQYALILLQETARKQPDNPEALYDLAKAAYSVGEVPEAETAMRSALSPSSVSQSNPPNGQAGALFQRTDEANRFLEMTALPANPAQLAAATAKVEQVLKSDPAYVPALMARAAISEQKAEAGAARQTYEKVLSLYPDFTPAKKRLAILYAKNPADNQKAYDLAIKAREAFPDDPELARAMGIILYRQKDFARAANVLQEVASQHTQDAELMYYLGMAQFRLNKRTESKQALQRAIELGLKADLAVEAKQTLTELK